MRKILVLASVSVLAACSSAPKENYERRAFDEQQRREAAVAKTLDQTPKWMTQLPVSANAVYANGSAVSSDLGMADNKAKLMAYGKICMAAGGRVDQRSRVLLQDSGDASYESSEMAIRSVCPGVDITGVETREVKRVGENGRYRSYVLVALPVGNANALQQRQDRLRLRDQATQRGERAFREMDDPKLH
jgi:hypothetical protein